MSDMGVPDVDYGPVWVEPIETPTKPPYGSPERAAYAAASRPGQDAATEGVLYDFDYTDSEDGPGSTVGSWDGRHWSGCFGGGIWSPQFVTAWRRHDAVIAKAVADAIAEKIEAQIATWPGRSTYTQCVNGGLEAGVKIAREFGESS